MTDELALLDATAQAELVRTGQVSAAELVTAAIERIEEMANAYAKVDAAEAEADANRIPTREDEEEVQRASYPCGMVSQFFCRMDGPLARACAETNPAQMVEREASSQRVQLVPANFQVSVPQQDVDPSTSSGQALGHTIHAGTPSVIVPAFYLA